MLTNRVQKVRIGGTLSNNAPLLSGVPQGSVLGPIFFLVFMRDLDNNIKDAGVKVLKYVDDSKVVAEVCDENGVISTQESLHKVYELAIQSNMKWNNGKF